MTYTYSISAGYYDSILRQRGDHEGHRDLAHALHALGEVCAAVSGGEPVTYGADDGGWLVYASQEDCDADSDGSRAIARISRVASCDDSEDE